MHNFRVGERLLAVVLAFVAGFVDSVGFLYLGGVFISFMSGNTTRSATSFIQGDGSLAVVAGTCIILFLVGVINGAVSNRVATRRWDVYRAREVVLVNVTVIFVVTSVLVLAGADRVAVYLLCVGMGTMNSVFERNGEVAIPLTYMTGTLVKMGQRLADTLFGGSHAVWLFHLMLWVALSIGAIVGAFAYLHLFVDALLVVTGVLLVTTVVNQLVRSARRRHGLPL